MTAPTPIPDAAVEAYREAWNAAWAAHRTDGSNPARTCTAAGLAAALPHLPAAPSGETAPAAPVWPLTLDWIRDHLLASGIQPYLSGGRWRWELDERQMLRFAADVYGRGMAAGRQERDEASADDGVAAASVPARTNAQATPAYVHRLLDAYLTGHPLDFGAAGVPADVVQRLVAAAPSGEQPTTEPGAVCAEDGCTRPAELRCNACTEGYCDDHLYDRRGALLCSADFDCSVDEEASTDAQPTTEPAGDDQAEANRP